jgi:prophage regulatory protein
MSKPRVKRPTSQPVIPAEGLVRVSALLGDRRRGLPAILPISRSGLYAWIRDGRWPAPIRLGPKIIAWPAQQIRETLDAMRATNN